MKLTFLSGIISRGVPCLLTCGIVECVVCSLKGNAGDAEHHMMMAKETIEQLKSFAQDLKQRGQPNDNVVKT